MKLPIIYFLLTKIVILRNLQQTNENTTEIMNIPLVHEESKSEELIRGSVEAIPSIIEQITDIKGKSDNHKKQFTIGNESESTSSMQTNDSTKQQRINNMQIDQNSKILQVEVNKSLSQTLLKEITLEKLNQQNNTANNLSIESKTNTQLLMNENIPSKPIKILQIIDLPKGQPKTVSEVNRSSVLNLSSINEIQIQGNRSDQFEKGTIENNKKAFTLDISKNLTEDSTMNSTQKKEELTRNVDQQQLDNTTKSSINSAQIEKEKQILIFHSTFIDVFAKNENNQISQIHSNSIDSFDIAKQKQFLAPTAVAANQSQFFFDFGLQNSSIPLDRRNHPQFKRVKKVMLPQKFNQKLLQLKKFKRVINGSRNNPLNEQIGQANAPFLRKCKANYVDGDFEPQSGFRSSRQISNMIGAIRRNMQLNKENVTFLFTIWGQFIDHDLDRTQPGSTISMNIPDGFNTILFTRSATDNKTPKSPINQITAWLDGSVVYGSSDAISRKLRRLTGGKLKTGGGNILPTFVPGGMEAGDSRSNENLVLLAIHTLFLREHNRVCDMIIRNSKDALEDEQIYTIAKNYVTALIQKITYSDYLPILLGEEAYKRFIGPYQGYNKSINAGIGVQFATAAFRFGHSLLVPRFSLVNSSGLTTNILNLSDLFFRPDLMNSSNLDEIFRGVSRTITKLRDGQFVEDVRNLLILGPNLRQLKTDLLAINIQRGKDHGLPHFNELRQCFGLKKLNNFDEVSGQKQKNFRLREAYRLIDDIDSYVGIQVQKSVSGSILGQTGIQINGQQFQRLRAGDRFWYENIFPEEIIKQIQQTMLSHIILRNTQVNQLQEDVFRYSFG